ncbi:MAG: glutamine synthetase [Gammaproteobacteria bacterium]|nr:MAG: glutamine synthetase [Gammaproteobacteria bacterium]
MQTLLGFLDAHPQIDVFEALLPDLNGRLRGKWLSREHLDKAFQGGLKLPLTTLGFDIWGRDPESWVFESGDADGICVGESNTLAPVPWLPQPTGQLLMSLRCADGTPCGYDPRDLLRVICGRFTRMGLTPVVALELEFYLFDAERDAFGRPTHSQRAIDGGPAVGGQTYSMEQLEEVAPLMRDIREACLAQQIPVDTLIAEAAPSQYEVNLYHGNDALLAADQGLMLQRLIRGVAKQHGKLATFMAKPFGELAGNGLHVHCSLVDEKGRNVFDNGTEQGSAALSQAVAGCLSTMADAMAIFAPNINACRRFQEGSHAPLAAAWGYENRTTALRIPTGHSQDRRIEHRVAGADANPYLVVAAILAGMLYGLEKQLQAPPPTEGDAYREQVADLPRYLPDALQCLEQSVFIGDYFGAEFQRVFLASKRQELAEFDRRVTTLEYDAYL